MYTESENFKVRKNSPHLEDQCKGIRPMSVGRLAHTRSLAVASDSPSSYTPQNEHKILHVFIQWLCMTCRIIIKDSNKCFAANKLYLNINCLPRWVWIADHCTVSFIVVTKFQLILEHL